MTRPKDCVLYIPPYRRGPKRNFQVQLGETFGGATTDADDIAALSPERIPIIGCYPEIADLKREWDRDGRAYIYRDNGYFRKPRWGRPWSGYWRWHWNCTQMRRVDPRPDDRLGKLRVSPKPWKQGGSYILVAAPGWAYAALFGLHDWVERTVDALHRVTDRPVAVRGKGSAKPFHEQLNGAWALVTPGSVAAIEAVMMGVPVFVDAESAASLVGDTHLANIETPSRPDRSAWLRSLAYSQFEIGEMLDGSMWNIFGRAQ